MRVVPDCNVLVSAARIDGTCRAVVDRAVRRHEIVLSEPILSEHEAVADRRGQAPYRDAMKVVIGEIERLAVRVEPADVVFGLRDPDDEIYLATAIAGGAVLRKYARLHAGTVWGGRGLVAAGLSRPRAEKRFQLYDTKQIIAFGPKPFPTNLPTWADWRSVGESEMSRGRERQRAQRWYPFGRAVAPAHPRVCWARAAAHFATTVVDPYLLQCESPRLDRTDTNGGVNVSSGRAGIR